MACNECNKINNTCGDKQFAACVMYEGDLPIISTILQQNGCTTLEMVVADLYQISQGILSEIDLEELLTNGIDYTLVGGKVVVKEALTQHATLIQELQQSLSNLQTGFTGDFNVTSWALDTECLQDSCDLPFTTLKQVIQNLITKVCELEQRIITLETTP